MMRIAGLFLEGGGLTATAPKGTVRSDPARFAYKISRCADEKNRSGEQRGREGSDELRYVGVLHTDCLWPLSHSAGGWSVRTMTLRRT